MKLKFLLLMFFISGAALGSNGNGDEVKNGGGLAEQYLAITLKNLPNIIDTCLSLNDCTNKIEERDLLLKIKNSIPEEIKADILKFKSMKTDPGFFKIAGFVRLAVTGNRIGSPIYYNLSLIYKGNEINMSYGQAVQTLIHELGHHHGNFDHDALELLGVKVRKSVENITSDVPYFPSIDRSISALARSGNTFNQNGELYLILERESVNLTPHFFYLNQECAEKTDISSNLQFFNLHWDISTISSFLSEDKVLKGNVFVNCLTTFSSSYRRVYEFELKVILTPEQDFIKSEFLKNPTLLFRKNLLYSITR